MLTIGNVTLLLLFLVILYYRIVLHCDFCTIFKLSMYAMRLAYSCM